MTIPNKGDKGLLRLTFQCINHITEYLVFTTCLPLALRSLVGCPLRVNYPYPPY